jgi:endogenous inhibitor of DNA gyrase (YacG/DUF329 family)
MDKKQLRVKCPTCHQQFNYYDSTYRPFCCEKCRLIDLGKWLDESYKIPGPINFKKNFDQMESDEESSEDQESNPNVSHADHTDLDLHENNHMSDFQ